MNTALMECFDTLIIGGGPVGLFGAYYAGLRDMTVRLVDRRQELGGQITAIYPEKWVYDIPGIPAIRGKELYQNLCAQIEPYHPLISLNDEVTLIRKNRNHIITVETKSGHIYYTKTVILCLGMGAHIPRKLPIENIEEFEGKGIHYGIANLETFRNKKVIVVGGGDSALDLALTIADVCKDLHLLHRSDRFTAHEETTKKIYYSNAEIRTFSEIMRLEGTEHITHALVRDTKTNNIQKLEVDEIIVAVGLLFNLEVVKTWGIEMEENCIKVDDYRQTSLHGIYAAGDIATYPGKMKLIGTGAAEVIQAVHHAKSYIQEKFPFL